jgi:hypothetical protein
MVSTTHDQHIFDHTMHIYESSSASLTEVQLHSLVTFKSTLKQSLKKYPTSPLFQPVQAFLIGNTISCTENFFLQSIFLLK